MAHKSAKLIREEEAARSQSASSVASLMSGGILLSNSSDDNIVIREVQCLNDNVAVMLFRAHAETSIQLPDSQQFKNEGIVVGIGPGITDGAGSRLPSQLKIGDVVTFLGKNVITEIESNSPPYAGRKIAIISERSLLCKLPSVKFTVQS